MESKRFLNVLLFLGAIGYTCAFYFPDGPPYKRQAAPSDVTFHPEPREVEIVPEQQKPTLPPTSRPGEETIHQGIVSLAGESSPSEDAEETNGTYVKPEPRERAIHTVVRRDARLEKRQTSCSSNYAFSSVGQSIRVQSQNYPRDYPNNLRTSLCLTSPAGTTMKVACDDFNVENENSCSYDYFGISVSGDPSRFVKYCGSGTLNSPNSSGNRLAIVFKSDHSNPRASSRPAYRYRCTVTVSGASGSNQTTSTPPPSGGGSDNCRCGRRNDGSRIVGGVDARPNSLPWRCYLRTNSYSFFCGCSVISNKWIMTAAHCTAAVMPLPAGETLYVVVGAHDRTSSNEASSQTISVANVYDHPDYNDDTMDNDISLLELSRSITFSDEVSPVCLPFKFANSDFANEEVTASGWGRTTQGGTTSNTLKEVQLPVLTTEQCSTYYPGQITDNMICTYNPGKDTCQGDSGGSIDMNKSGRYYAIGVVSWGIGCAQNRRPGVYAKTTKYLSFIQTTTREQFCQL